MTIEKVSTWTFNIPADIPSGSTTLARNTSPLIKLPVSVLELIKISIGAPKFVPSVIILFTAFSIMAVAPDVTPVIKTPPELIGFKNAVSKFE